MPLIKYTEEQIYEQISRLAKEYDTRPQNVPVNKVIMALGGGTRSRIKSIQDAISNQKTVGPAAANQQFQMLDHGQFLKLFPDAFAFAEKLLDRKHRREKVKAIKRQIRQLINDDETRPQAEGENRALAQKVLNAAFAKLAQSTDGAGVEAVEVPQLACESDRSGWRTEPVDDLEAAGPVMASDPTTTPNQFDCDTCGQRLPRVETDDFTDATCGADVAPGPLAAGKPAVGSAELGLQEWERHGGHMIVKSAATTSYSIPDQANDPLQADASRRGLCT